MRTYDTTKPLDIEGAVHVRRIWMQHACDSLHHGLRPRSSAGNMGLDAREILEHCGQRAERAQKDAGMSAAAHRYRAERGTEGAANLKGESQI
jgi:hypothetical protein